MCAGSSLAETASSHLARQPSEMLDAVNPQIIARATDELPDRSRAFLAGTPESVRRNPFHELLKARIAAKLVVEWIDVHE